MERIRNHSSTRFPSQATSDEFSALKVLGTKSGNLRRLRIDQLRKGETASSLEFLSRQLLSGSSMRLCIYISVAFLVRLPTR